jgi:hypothetical protein
MTLPFPASFERRSPTRSRYEDEVTGITVKARVPLKGKVLEYENRARALTEPLSCSGSTLAVQ